MCVMYVIRFVIVCDVAESQSWRQVTSSEEASDRAAVCIRGSGRSQI